MAFSFGAPQPPPSNNSSTAQSSAPQAFSFANNNTQSNASTTGFSFGQQQQQSQQPQQPQQQPQQPSGFSFGQPQQQQQPSAPGFSFGQPQQQNQQPSSSSTGFSFGQPPSQPQPQPQSTSTNNQLAQSQFGVSQLGQSNANHPQPDKRLGISLAPQFESIRQAWDTNNLQTCRFITYFYNNIPPSALPVSYPPSTLSPFEHNPNFGRRQDAVGPVHDALWSRAVHNNPEPSHLVPVLAVGFNDLKARIDAQETETNRQATHVNTINQRITALEQKHTLSDSVRASNALKRQAALHHRILRITRKSHLLIPSLRGSTISRQEEALRVKLEQCEAELDSNSSSSSSNSTDTESTARLRSRVNELWAMLGSVKAKRQALESSGRRPAPEWAVVDETGVQDVVHILAQQQQGLNHLIQTLEDDSKALDVVMQGLKGVQLVGVRGGQSHR